jgi:hypothetical protein
VTVLTLSACEEIDLPLAAAPFSAGIEVEDTQRWRGGHTEECGRQPNAATRVGSETAWNRWNRN